MLYSGNRNTVGLEKNKATDEKKNPFEKFATMFQNK